TIENTAKKIINLSYGETTKHLMEELAYEVVTRNYFSNSCSGIVISGFGEDELIPSLYELRIEGFVLGQLKFENGSSSEIKAVRERVNSTAVIVPFAQAEMVHTFMKGIDPHINQTLKNLISDIVSDIPGLIHKETDVRLENDQVL